MKKFDIAVVGGGASGMMAAVTCARSIRKSGKQADIVVLEQFDKLGRKLLATGNGRCNLSNTDISSEHYHGDIFFAEKILNGYSCKSVLRYFEQLGLFCRADSEGRVYPLSLQSSTVNEILRLNMNELGVEIIKGFTATDVVPQDNGFIIKGESEIFARQVIIAAGGKADKRLGGSGFASTIAKRTGHTVIEEAPALVMLRSHSKLLPLLKGARAKATVTLLDNGKAVRTEQGEVQFTAEGLSGICIFQLSAHAGEIIRAGRNAEISINLLPFESRQSLQKQIASQCKRFSTLPSEDVLIGLLNSSIGRAVMRSMSISQQSSTITYDMCGDIAERIQDFRFEIFDTGGFDKAQVTAGGVSCKELSESMESKLCKGMYFTGECINLHGDCGGYNLHLAWTTGIIAGKSAGEHYLKGKEND